MMATREEVGTGLRSAFVMSMGVMYGRAESLYCTPETHIMLDANELELNKNFKKCSSY